MFTSISLSLTLLAQDTGERPPTDPNDGRSFTSVISDLHKSYPKDRMEEISTSFCFICLLHLANERGLKLEVDGKVEEDENAMQTEEDRAVGNLWDLKVGSYAAYDAPLSYPDHPPYRCTGTLMRRRRHSYEIVVYYTYLCLLFLHFLCCFRLWSWLRYDCLYCASYIYHTNKSALFQTRSDERRYDVHQYRGEQSRAAFR